MFLAVFKEVVVVTDSGLPMDAGLCDEEEVGE
jgi:hypothetical protein